MHGLRDLRVVDFSTDIPGAYATKLLADAGADVIKVEPPTGDPLRRWSATGADLSNEDGALFRFLCFSKRSVVGAFEDAATERLIESADLVVSSGGVQRIDGAALAARQPGLVVLEISPFGSTGPWADRPATEFTVQAQCGSIGTRGLPGGEPFQAGGRTTEWLAGTYSALAAAAALYRAKQTGHGEHVDFSVHEVMNIAGTSYTALFASLLGFPVQGELPQSIETPSIEPTRDGYVGFCTNTPQQFSDFLLLIERTDLRSDEELAQVGGRVARLAEWNEIVHSFTLGRTTSEIVESASLLRIPVSPVNDGEAVQEHVQLVAREVFRDAPVREGERPFRYPRPPYRIGELAAPAQRRAPLIGEHETEIAPHARHAIGGKGEPGLPLSGLTVIDMTAWWAGPSATEMLAALGADVIHVESPTRPDGMRMIGAMLRGRHDAWWECSPFFLAANANKRGIAIDLAKPAGVAALKRLISKADAVFENFTPRVMDAFGLTWDVIHALNPQAIYVRMPAFGLTGPWRDNTGFAQTMEQMTGLAWLTGHADDQPRIQRGPCDPLAGMHAAFAFLVALSERAASGQGVHVECTMVEGALNAASEQLLEFTAYGNRMQREGNRGPAAAPQGLYRCKEKEGDGIQWLALAVATDEQWRALVKLLEAPSWAKADAFETHKGRRARHDEIDEHLAPVFALREREELVEALLAAGIPAAPVAEPRLAPKDPQLSFRGFYEAFTHPVVGTHAVPTLPFRYASVKKWLRGVAPTLGQHNHEVLRSLGGLSEEETLELEAEGVIGTQLVGL